MTKITKSKVLPMAAIFTVAILALGVFAVGNIDDAEASFYKKKKKPSIVQIIYQENDCKNTAFGGTLNQQLNCANAGVNQVSTGGYGGGDNKAEIKIDQENKNEN
ncbi:MAG: hypothetical protein QXU32_04045 [Nitrososphaerales archaeon]